jgi:branched-chain amino acid transport system ATP-binding protein
MTALLSCTDLSAGYGDLVAVDGISLELQERQILGIVGPNGAGKSTLLRALTGVIPLKGGSVRWGDREIGHLPADARARMGMAMVQEGRRLFPSRSVADNLAMGAYHADRQARRDRQEEVLELFPALRALLKRTARVLSGGEQQMVAVGRALMSKPTCLLIDEPSLGLAPVIVDQIYESLRPLMESGVSVILVEQEVGRVLNIADQLVVLHEGSAVHRGPAQQFRDDPESLREVYLGRRPGAGSTAASAGSTERRPT